ncbi:hypothetical protein M413DRAFT_28477 [Hebeloma cylindrosporum]|uniref:Enoyl reductase (ER) domain-containing protein n=1 Tax=Hebeloma cylindrosporum TaxID=76867 RepID=A0A0C3CAT5_HEBCY|nr:hypothetical protein M413DRAFT_28477 [Hebeloma cylindrosporum h7]
MSPAKQKALLLDTKTKEFAVGDVEVYKPGPGEVLIKIQAAALNPVDWKIQRSSVGGQFPEYRILGEDISGDVVEVGKGVTNFKEGDRVFAETEFGKSHGGFQQYALSLASVVAKIPPGISYDEAATIPLALSTSYVGLHHQGTETPLVVLGGGSSVGQLCIQLAKLSGLSPIITTASLKHTEHLKALGATNVLDRNLSIANISQRVKEITKSPILRVVDAISLPSTQELASALLASGGYLAVVLSPAVEAEGKTVIRVSGVLRAPGNIEILEDLYQNKASVLLESGAIRPLRYEVLPNGLAGISDGLARMEGDQISGVKLVAHPQETV